MLRFDREIFFNSVRPTLFSDSLSQQQVDGMNAILAVFEARALLGGSRDLRHLAYPLSTTYHECSQAMWPIEEYGKGEGMAYGQPAGPYDEIYYGRGLVQLTWWENYVKARNELHLSGENDLERYPQRALDPFIAAAIMFRGMTAGWFRTADDGDPENLERYFSDVNDDAFEAREIINGDKNKVPSWSNGKSIGQLCVDYHEKFLAALEEALTESDDPFKPTVPEVVISYSVESTKPVRVIFEEVD